MKKIISHSLVGLVLVLSSEIINAETQYFYCGYANLDGTGQDYSRSIKGGELSAYKYNKDKKRWEWITEYTYQYIYDNGKYEQITRSAIFDNQVGKCNKEMEKIYKNKMAEIYKKYAN